MQIISKIRGAINAISAPFASKGLILLYHRVAELPSDPQLLAVSPIRFAEHLEILRQKYALCSLTQLSDDVTKRRVTNRSVVITFDDGYGDNLYQAAPALKHWDTPATFYVTSASVGSQKEFFWDELERIFLQPGSLPPHLQVNAGGVSFTRDMGQWSDYSALDFEKHRHWNVTIADAPTSRHEAYRSLCDLLQPLSHEMRETTLATLRQWAGLCEQGRPTHLSLTASEVRELARNALVEVGAHTKYHSLLSSLPADQQRDDIAESKRQLEVFTGKGVMSFSYPFGCRSAYTDETAAIVRSCGFRCACSNFPGIVRNGTNLFQLPRVLIRNWSKEEFLKRIEDSF